MDLFDLESMDSMFAEQYDDIEPETTDFEEPDYNAIDDDNDVENEDGFDINDIFQSSSSNEPASSTPVSSISDEDVQSNALFDSIGVTTYKNEPNEKQNISDCIPDSETDDDQTFDFGDDTSKENTNDVTEGNNSQNIIPDIVDEVETEQSIKDVKSDNAKTKVESKESIEEFTDDNAEDDSEFVFFEPNPRTFNESKNADIIIDERNTFFIRFLGFLKTSEILKKAAMFLVLLVFITGVPVVVSLIQSRTKTKEPKQTPAVYSNYEADNKANSNITVDKIVFEEASTQAYIGFTEVNKTSRFDSIDDLTLYLSSNIGATLSTEKQAVKKLNNNEISLNDFYATMDACRITVDELNHLLIANKNVYSEHNLTETYFELSEDIDSLIAYGDSAKYNVDIALYQN